MRFFILIFTPLLLISHISKSQENITNQNVIHPSDMEALIKSHNIKWNKFFIPSKKCHEDYLATHNDYDLNHFIKCKATARKQKEIFDNLHKKEVILLNKYNKQKKEKNRKKIEEARQKKIKLHNKLLSEKNDITVIINNYEKLWNEYYKPSKKCTKKHLEHYNFKQFVKCNDQRIEERFKFSVLHKNATQLIQDHKKKLEDKARLENNRVKFEKSNAEKKSKLERIKLGYIDLKTRQEYINDSSMLCKKKWTKRGVLDSRMSDHCFSGQMDGYEELKVINANYSEKPFYYKISYPHCKKTWVKRSIVDTRMLAYCLKNEIEGKKDVEYYYTQYSREGVQKIVSKALTRYNSWNMAAYEVKKVID